MNKTLILIGTLSFSIAACDGEEATPTETPTEAIAEGANPAPTPTPTPAPSGGGGSNFGTVSLAAGFTAPSVVEGRSGGSTDASTLSAECVGNVSDTPDHLLELGAAMDTLHIFAAAEQDITLVVQRPDGTFSCDDDSDGTNPMVTAETFPAGSYKIWIGNYDTEAGAAPYRLGFSVAEDASPTLLAQQ